LISGADSVVFHQWTITLDFAWRNADEASATSRCCPSPRARRIIGKKIINNNQITSVNGSPTLV
jgi:hypothetical protein